MKRIISLLTLILVLLLISCKTKNVIVSFEVNGGSEVSDIVIKKGSFIEEPVSEKIGYEFLGWYYDSEFINKFDSKKRIYNDITLYAKFEIKFLQFSPHGLEEVNNTIEYRINYTITFEYLSTTGERGNIYFKIEGTGSTSTSDSGILESNMDPEGITWLANDNQYMNDNGEYLYVPQAHTSGGEKIGIYYYADYFRTNLLSTSLWNSSSFTGKYYKDEIGYYYVNSNGNYLRIDDDTIIISKESGTAFNKSWIDNDKSYIDYIDKIIITDVNKTDILIEPSDLLNAKAYSF